MAMQGEHDRPTETSPLLGRASSHERSSATETTEPAAGIATEGVVSDQPDGAVVERQTTDEDRKRQYEGIPEVRQRMKYMFPALSIGVFFAAADQTLIVSSYGKIGTDLGALNKTSWVATG